MEAASAPAGKPPAKRLGKHRASRPSDWGGILENKYRILGYFLYKTPTYVDSNKSKVSPESLNRPPIILVLVRGGLYKEQTIFPCFMDKSSFGIDS